MSANLVRFTTVGQLLAVVQQTGNTRRVTSEMIDVNVTEHVAHVRLDRPEKHNALNGELMASLILAATTR